MHCSKELRDIRKRHAELQEEMQRTPHLQEKKELEREFWQEEERPWRDGAYDMGRISLRRIWDETVPDGRAIREAAFDRDLSRYGVRLQEAGAVNTSLFANIIGQFSWQNVLGQFENPAFLADQLVTKKPSSTAGVEIVPGIAGLGDIAQTVGEGQPFPPVGTSQEYVTIPRKDKRGAIVPVTKEMISEDKTGLLIQRLSAVGEAMAINYEKEVLDVVLGVTDTYSRNGGAVQATYGNTHTEGDFDNLVASNDLVDYTDINNALLAFDAITDPNTGEPIMVGEPYDLIVPSALKLTAKLLEAATQVKYGADSGSLQSLTINPFPLVARSNQYVKARSGSATTWWIGNAKKAFSYSEWWPVMTEQAPANSPESFYSDIGLAYKVSRFGKAYVEEPRYMVKCTS